MQLYGNAHSNMHMPLHTLLKAKITQESQFPRCSPQGQKQESPSVSL